jgi:hypothetical protein
MQQNLWGGVGAYMEDKKMLNMMKYVAAKKLITSIVESLPDQIFSVSEIRDEDKGTLNASNIKKIETLNNFIGYYPPSIFSLCRRYLFLIQLFFLPLLQSLLL